MSHELPVMQVIEHFKLAGEVQGVQLHMRCPFHDERTPSFDIHLRKGYFSCFGCGIHGDLIEFVSLMDGGDRVAAIRLIHDLRKRTPPARLAEAVEDAREARPREYDLYQQWRSFHLVNWQRVSLRHPAARYLISERGFRRATLAAFDVRLTERVEYPVVIPIFRDSELLGYVYRLIEPREGLKKYRFNSGFDLRSSVAYQEVEPGPCVITEGMLDMMKCVQFGSGHVCSILTWRISIEQAAWLRARLGESVVVCALDNTPTGERGWRRMRRLLPRVVRFTFPFDRKDVGELSAHEYAKGLLDALDG